MSADNSHAERKIAKRQEDLNYALMTYDNARTFGADDYVARKLGASRFVHRAGCDCLEAHEVLADALATRAASRG